MELIADWKFVEVNRGDTAVMQCVTTKTSSNAISWFKNGNLPVISEGNKIRVSSTGRLEINDAQIADSGVYVCSMEVAGIIKKDNVTLTVVDKGYKQFYVFLLSKENLGLFKNFFPTLNLHCLTPLVVHTQRG